MVVTQSSASPVNGALTRLPSWTMVYDTTYACQDMKDDKMAGVKSTALLFGSWIRPLLALFATVFIASLAAVGVIESAGLGYFAIGVMGSALHITWQVGTVQLDNPSSCWSASPRA